MVALWLGMHSLPWSGPVAQADGEFLHDLNLLSDQMLLRAAREQRKYWGLIPFLSEMIQQA